MTQPDLFADERRSRVDSAAPLAARMRPRNLDEVVGQQHLLAPGAAFRTMVEAGRPLSMILFGPPGTGKTTLARLVASASDASFEQLSAVNAGVKDVREVLATARSRLEVDERRTVLFLDEIHRFTKSQQDALLPGVESGIIILIGATTENPFFEVNSPLISRSSLFRTESLEPNDIVILVQRAVTDKRGIPESDISDEAAQLLAERVGGDARLALNTLEMASIIATGRGRSTIEDDDLEEALQRRIIRYDKKGDEHYDVISAFIKSVRGSDVDASLYWLHTMLMAGEDPEFIARRMIILASEDVGLGDPAALGIAVDAFQALRVVGLPEAEYALTHAAIYLALAPKSNSITTAMAAARQAVEATTTARVPMHLMSASTEGEKAMGEGIGYRYPHSDERGVVPQQYLPEQAGDAQLYQPKLHGAERTLAERLDIIDRILGKPPRRTDGGP